MLPLCHLARGGAQGSPPTHSDEVVHVESQPHSGTRTQGFWLPDWSSCPWPRLPGGVRGQPPEPCKRRGSGLVLPQSLRFRVFLGCYAFGTTRPAFPGRIPVYLQCQRCRCRQPSSAVPSRPRPLGSGCFCRRPFLPQTPVACPSFLQPVCKSSPQGARGRALRHSLQHPPVLWPCAQNLRVGAPTSSQPAR